jgi:hypothetical protein
MKKILLFTVFSSIFLFSCAGNTININIVDGSGKAEVENTEEGNSNSAKPETTLPIVP